MSLLLKNKFIFIIIIKITVKLIFLKKMHEDFDFDTDQIDQKISIGSLPVSLVQSLAGSRIVKFNTQQQQLLPSQYQSSKNDLKEQSKKINKKDIRIKQIQILQQNKILKECTFKPKTNVTKQQKRDFKQFLCSQENYSKKLNQKMQRLRSNKQNKQNNQIYLQNKKGSAKHNSRMNQSVFVRLYNKKNKNHRPNYKADINNTFHPHINQRSKQMIRQQSIDQILYKDAKKRKQKSTNKNYETKMEQVEHKKINNSSRTEQYVIRKFLKQFMLVLQKLQISDFFQLNIQRPLFMKIIRDLRFTKSSSQEFLTNTQKQLVNFAYDYISRVRASSFNIFIFLLSTIGVFNNNNIFKAMNLDKGKAEEYFDQQLLVIPQSQCIIFHKKYDFLYRNRLNSQQTNLKQAQQFKFSPQISPKSEFLAQKRRKYFISQAVKLLQMQVDPQVLQAQSITHPQFLILNKQIKDIELQLQRSVERSRELQQCTFTPKINMEKKQLKQNKKLNQKKQPVLILDVNFGDKQDKITLGQQNAKQLVQISKEYADKYNMNKQSQLELLELLKAEFKLFFQYL